ncbi:hypothetical protein EB796_007540 [Bugula neritina]|uniref:Uncharacterized protein n=1 Tax=Bugula neritina TaxID=10212 RepID=A0A7J7K7F3_BUGNE|nr:hypothetical protein EB796_007540 [Bugula neritina]
MFKKFTDTLSGTLDTVKSYGSSMVIGQTTQDGSTDKAPANKLSLTLPTIGNGSVSAPATTANSPDKPGQKTSLAANTLLGIQNTLGKITGRGDSTNAVVVASQKGHTGRGPTLGNAVITDVTRITDKHVIDDDIRGMAAEDISDFEQYKKVPDLLL